MPLAAVLGVASVAGAVIQGSAAKSAANAQVKAETQAQQIMQQQYQQTRADLLPYNQAGQAATTQIENMAPFAFQPTQAQLEATPGYQFALSQGLKSVQNSAAARGLGVSGAAQKGAAGFATGLADQTYQNQFANALATYNQNLARLQGLQGVGESAAAQTGAFGTQTASNIGQTAVGIGNAQAAGQVGSANAISGALGGLSNAFITQQYLNNPSAAGGIFGGGGGGTGGYFVNGAGGTTPYVGTPVPF